MSYDQKCADLAAVFLSDFEMSGAERAHRTTILAQDIQDAIENYIADAELKEKAQP